MTASLHRKLGVLPTSRVLVLGAPADFPVYAMPDGVTLHRRRGGGSYDVIVAFCTDSAALAARFAPNVDALTVAGGFWVCWPKRASGVPTDLSDDVVRAFGLATGLVDVKVAAIDGVWSGLKFVRRRSDRPTS